MAMRLVQLLDTNGERIVGVSTAGTTARRVNGATSVHALANEAVAANTTLACYLTRPSDTGVGVFYIPIW